MRHSDIWKEIMRNILPIGLERKVYNETMKRKTYKSI